MEQRKTFWKLKFLVVRKIEQGDGDNTGGTVRPNEREAWAFTEITEELLRGGQGRSVYVFLGHQSRRCFHKDTEEAFALSSWLPFWLEIQSRARQTGQGGRAQAAFLTSKQVAILCIYQLSLPERCC